MDIAYIGLGSLVLIFALIVLMAFNIIDPIPEEKDPNIKQED